MSSSEGGEPEFKKRTPPGLKPVKSRGQAITPGARLVERDRLSWHQFTPDAARYEKMPFRRCGTSGLWLSSVSLGARETFGGYVGPEQARASIFRAFNLGITHFDLANTYGTPRGRAEIMVGRVLREMPRNELAIATKAGFPMSPGPYGEGSSRKALISSLDQSLHRLGVDHVDIFYSHRPDPSAPLEETLRALDQLVRQGKALYIGLCDYPAALLAEACRLVAELNLMPIVAAQVSYNLLEHEDKREMISVARQNGIGIIASSALGAGLLTTKYFDGFAEGSRAARSWSPRQREKAVAAREKIRQLNEVAKTRGQTLPQMALAWTLRAPEITSALMGVSDVDQVEENAMAVEKLEFSDEESRQIDGICEALQSPRGPGPRRVPGSRSAP